MIARTCRVRSKNTILLLMYAVTVWCWGIRRSMYDCDQITLDNRHRIFDTVYIDIHPPPSFCHVFAAPAPPWRPIYKHLTAPISLPHSSLLSLFSKRYSHIILCTCSPLTKTRSTSAPWTLSILSAVIRACPSLLISPHPFQFPPLHSIPTITTCQNTLYATGCSCHHPTHVVLFSNHHLSRSSFCKSESGQNPWDGHPLTVTMLR